MERNLTFFMDEVANVEIRAISPNQNWTDWADWHRYLHPTMAQSFKAFREAAERYANYRAQQERELAVDKALEEAKWHLHGGKIIHKDVIPKMRDKILNELNQNTPT